jgi:hypothetical protein
MSITAIPAELPRPLAAWFDSAAGWEVRAAELLAISLSLSTDELDELLRTVFDITPPDGWADVLRALPVIESEASGLVCKATAAEALAAAFHARDPDAFRVAHELLVDLERERRDAGLEESGDIWFFDVRVAFYLAGADPSASVAQFERGFLETPGDGTTAARMWVTSMVLRQQRLLADHERELSFFRGFSNYVTGRVEEARQDLGKVVDEPRDDRITAVAEHLLAVLVRDRDLVRATDLCRRAVERSEQLDFDVNLIMAANTLAGLRLRDAHGPGEAIEDAVRLAKDNLSRASRRGDATLLARCQITFARARWTQARALGTAFDPAALMALADSLVPLLTEAQQATHDTEAVLFAAALQAEMLAETDRSARAIGDLAEAFTLPGSTRALKRVRAVARAIRERPTAGPATRDAAEELSARVDAELVSARERHDELLLAV